MNRLLAAAMLLVVGGGGIDETLAQSLSIVDTVVTEGDAGVKTAVFTVSLTGAPSTPLPPEQPVTVRWATEDLTATAGTDYESASGELVFDEGGQQRTIEVQVYGDLAAGEGSETFLVKLSQPTGGVVIVDGVAHGVIADDDSVPTTTRCDLDQNGGSDILVAYQIGPPTHLPVHRDIGLVSTAGKPGTSAGFTGYHLSAAADFDGNGTCDLFWEGDLEGSSLALTATPPGSPLNGVTDADLLTVTRPPAAWQVLGSGDFNQDGRADLVWWDAEAGSLVIWTDLGSFRSEGDPRPPVAYSLKGPKDGRKPLAILDVNADGYMDVLWRKPDGPLSYWQLREIDKVPVILLDDTLIPGLVPTAGWRLSAVADINGDGFDDLLWQEPSSTPRVVAWFLSGLSLRGAAELSIKWSALLGGDVEAWEIVGPR